MTEQEGVQQNARPDSHAWSPRQARRTALRERLPPGGSGQSQAGSRVVDVRARRDDDLDELVTIAARVHAADGYPIFLPDRGFARFLTRPKPVAAWVAVRERIVGHVALNAETSRPVMALVTNLALERPALFVARLLVDPEARRQGVGRNLLEQARRAAVDSGHCPMLHVVETPKAEAAISLYRGDGWEEVGRVPFDRSGAEVDELVFRGPQR
jgi:GNAT superfamily N-acetyltransferase